MSYCYVLFGRGISYLLAMHGPHKSGISEKSMIVREFYCYQGESGKIDNCKIGLSQSRKLKISYS